MTHNHSAETHSSALPWRLIVSLALVGLIRPILNITQVVPGDQWSSVGLTVLISAIWIYAVVSRHISRTFFTMVTTGGIFGVLTMILFALFEGPTILSPETILGLLVYSIAWGALVGILATGIQYWLR